MTHHLTRIIVAIALWSGAAMAAAGDARALNALLDTVLAAHVKDGYIDYPSIARNVRFNKYVEALAAADVDALTEESDRIAFWLNVYNGLAIKQVVDGTTPLNAIGRMKFFRTTEHEVGGRSYDLQDIEQMLDDFGDARVRLAMVNASYAGPDLPSETYRGEDLEQQLDAAVRRFVNDNRKNRFSATLRRAKLSELFEWHEDLFGDSRTELFAFLARYIDDKEVAESLAAGGGWEVEFLEFEWSINGRPM